MTKQKLMENNVPAWAKAYTGALRNKDKFMFSIAYSRYLDGLCSNPETDPGYGLGAMARQAVVLSLIELKGQLVKEVA